MKTMLTLLACMLALLAPAQVDTSATPPPVKWGWTDPPPPMNLVEAGLALERSAQLEGASWWCLLGIATVGGVFHLSGEPAAGNVVLGTGVGLWMGLQVASVRPKRKAGGWLKQGWHTGARYEAQPDSVGPAPAVPMERPKEEKR